jgi:hypothetical protein
VRVCHCMCNVDCRFIYTQKQRSKMLTIILCARLFMITSGAFIVDFNKNSFGARKWSTSNIPFAYDRTTICKCWSLFDLHLYLAPDEIKVVDTAMRMIENRTCVRFVEDPNDIYFISIQRSNDNMCVYTINLPNNNVHNSAVTVV